MSNNHVNITFHRNALLRAGDKRYAPEASDNAIGFRRDSFPMLLSNYLNPGDGENPIVTIESARQYGLDFFVDGKIFLQLGGSSKVSIPVHHLEGADIKIEIADFETDLGETDTRPGVGLGGVGPDAEDSTPGPRTIDELEPQPGEDGTINADEPPPSQTPDPAGEGGDTSPESADKGVEGPDKGGEGDDAPTREEGAEDGAQGQEPQTSQEGGEEAQGKPVEGNPNETSEGANEGAEGEGGAEGRAG